MGDCARRRVPVCGDSARWPAPCSSSSSQFQEITIVGKLRLWLFSCLVNMHRSMNCVWTSAPMTGVVGVDFPRTELVSMCPYAALAAGTADHLRWSTTDQRVNWRATHRSFTQIGTSSSRMDLFALEA